MKDLALMGKDLLPAGRGFATVTGTAYLRQRVAKALAEPYGFNPYHPLWGSALRSYLGAPQTEGTPALISSEVSRVLSQIMAAQQAALTRSAAAGQRSQMTAADVIASVDSVSASTGPSLVTVAVAVSLTTQAGNQIQITRTVSA